MKWNTLSEAGLALVRQLGDESNAWLGRSGKMTSSLRALGALSEPAAIPAIVDYLLDDDLAVAQETAAVVAALFTRIPPELLPTLDERIRADSYWACPTDRWRKLAAGAIDRLRKGPTHALVLGLASCHGSGYVRQSAITRLDREITSGLEIPFLLLRLNDWVSSVRHVAEQSIERRLTDSHRAAYLQNLALVARLRSRLRASKSPTLARIEALLRADTAALVRGALASEGRVARRFGLSLALDALCGTDAYDRGAALEQVIGSNDPAVRLQATCWLTQPTAPLDLQHQILPRLLDDRFVAVRRVALGWCAAREPQLHLLRLREALLDESCTIRSIAQFHLPKLEPIDLRDFYRTAVRQRDPRSLNAALGGLGETGRTDDAELVVPSVDAPEPKIRKAALGALAKLALEAHVEIFIGALQAGSPGVSRQARLALNRHAQSVGADRLAAIFADSPHPHVRRQALSLINRLPKWQKLPLLIEIYGGSEDSAQRTAESFLRSWLWTYNRTHQVQPTKPEIARLRLAIATHGSKFERRLGVEFHAITGSLSNRDVR
ncbi:MAG: HEAT repeat domain-containing protein [Chthoniobacteraceae bacterium]